MRVPTIRSASRLGTAALVLAGGGCASGGEPAPAQRGAGAEVAAAAPADSLVLEGPGGITVWFTDARTATAADGTTCLERALQFRQDTTRRGVPLLYTREAPTLLGSDAIRAVLYNNCQPVAAYRVDFETISPKRLP